MTPRPAAHLYGLVLALLFLITGCDTDAGDSLYDPDRTKASDPVVSDVSPVPTELVLAGIDEVTITGQNFSATASDNLVYFNEVRAEVLSASATELVVRAPNLPLDDIELRVVVLGAENFSNSAPYTLTAAAVDFAEITRTEGVFGLTVDDEGNIYASLSSEGLAVGVKKIAPDGTRSDYFESSFTWGSLAFGPDGVLYGVRSPRAVFQLPEGGSQVAWAVLDNGVSLSAITFDAQGNVWTGGNNAALYRVAPDKTVTPYAFEATVRDLAVYGGYLYAAAVMEESGSGVWRFDLGAEGGLGEAELFFDMEAAGGGAATALAFAANGDLYLGTDQADPILIVSPDGSYAPLYPGIIRAPAFDLVWGDGTYLYMTKGEGNESDAELSRPNLLRIETRQQGAD